MVHEPHGGSRLGQPHAPVEDILQGVLDPLLILDDQLRGTLANPAFYEAFDLTPEQVLGQEVYQIYNGLWDIPELRRLLNDVREHGKAFKDYELTHHFESIGRRTMLLNASKLEVERGPKRSILLAMKDITSRAEATDALRRSEQQLRMIFENATEFAIISMDLDGHVTAWNPGAERLLGYKESEILGQDARIIFTKEDRQKGKADQELRTALEKGRAQDERWHVRKDGSQFWGNGIVMPLTDDGEPRGLIKIMRDMTSEYELHQQREAYARELEQHVAEATVKAEERARQLETLTQHLQQAEQHERRRLARLLHDDLQQLLVAANMRIQMVENASTPQATLGEIRQILNQAIDTSRSLSHELSPSVLWDHGFVAALDWLANLMRKRHQLPVEVKAEEKVGRIVPAEVGETLFQMVRELLFNVVKHAKASQAWIVAETMGEAGLRLAIEDNGVGFEPDILEGNEHQRGHGLRNIRERMVIWQGQLKIEPRPEGGCRVVLEIPEVTEPSTT